jgi:hypothetical protein
MVGCSPRNGGLGLPQDTDDAADGPADTLESDSKLKPGQNPVIGYDSPANK